MNWLLVILVINPDGSASPLNFGYMANETVCEATGEAIAFHASVYEPELIVGWTCEKAGAA